MLSDLIVPKWLKTAYLECGVDEHNHDRIAVYLKVVGISYDPSIPWCAAFVAWTLKQSGMVYFKSARARDWLSYGVDVTETNPPPYGSIIVLWRGSITASTGHVGFYLGSDLDYVWVFGGNQSSCVMVKPYPKLQVMGYRWPITNGKG